MAFISFNDGSAATLSNGMTGIAAGVGSRFTDWVPFQKPIGAAAVALGTGARSMYTFRTDYGASFAITEIPNTSMSIMLRLQAHLLNGGTVSVSTGDTASRTYPTCCLAPEGEVTITLVDKATLRYSMTFTLINVAVSPTAMICEY